MPMNPSIRDDFPILARTVYNHPLIYLDNAATTQKPRCVVEAISEEYYNVNANVHRGVHFLSQQATDLHELARERVRQFVGARSTSEILFTRGTTEAINLLAAVLPLHPQDEVVVSAMEHHSNIVPWQMACERSGAKLRIIPIDDDGRLRLDAYAQLLNEHTRIVCVCHVSNVLGTLNPVEQIIRMAHDAGAKVLIDGAQSAPHLPIDVQAMDCDFFAFSGHKTYGPTGVGVLYGKEALLDQLPPYQGGGEMIRNVTFEHTTFNDLPYKFEAGTPDYVGTHALAVALDYITAIGLPAISQHEQQLTAHLLSQLRTIEGLQIYGHATPADNNPVVSFNVEGIHHLDLGTLLDRLGVAVRTGHHCAEPLVHRLGVEGTVRASLSFYNTRDEVDQFIAHLRRVIQMFQR